MGFFYITPNGSIVPSKSIYILYYLIYLLRILREYTINKGDIDNNMNTLI